MHPSFYAYKNFYNNTQRIAIFLKICYNTKEKRKEEK